MFLVDNYWTIFDKSNRPLIISHNFIDSNTAAWKCFTPEQAIIGHFLSNWTLIE